MNEQKMQPQSTPPPNYLVFAILTTIFCCQILGIVSIIYAAQVNSRWSSGDIEGAESASRNAKIWAWVAFGSAFIIMALVTFLSMLGVFVGLGLEAFNW